MALFRIITSVVRSIFSGIAQDPELQKIIKRNPRLFGFLKRRLVPDEAFGLRLTVGALATSLFVFFFFGVARQMIGNDALIDTDVSIVNFFQLARFEGMNQVMVFFSTLERWSVIFIGVIATAIVCIRARLWHYLISLVTAVCVSVFFSNILREFIDTVRPQFANTLVVDSGVLFPSGHTFVAFTFYSLIIYWIARSYRSVAARVSIAWAGILFVFMIAFSGIYLGINWPADVAASSASAAAWVAIIITILEMRNTQRLPNETTQNLSLFELRLIGAAAFFCWVGVSMYIAYVQPIHITQPNRAPSQFISLDAIPEKLFISLPKYSETLLGKPTEPINLIFVGRQQTIDDTFKKAGWSYPGTISIPNLWRAFIAAIRDDQDLRAPITPMFWNTLPNTSSYLKATSQNSVRERHHVRIWDSGVRTKEGDYILFGAASFDSGIKLRSSMIIPAHRIDPAIDKERDYITESLQATGNVKKVQLFSIVDPTLGKNITGDTFFTDGKSAVIYFSNNTE